MFVIRVENPCYTCVTLCANFGDFGLACSELVCFGVLISGLNNKSTKDTKGHVYSNPLYVVEIKLSIKWRVLLLLNSQY